MDGPLDYMKIIIIIMMCACFMCNASFEFCKWSALIGRKSDGAPPPAAVRKRRSPIHWSTCFYFKDSLTLKWQKIMIDRWIDTKQAHSQFF